MTVSSLVLNEIPSIVLRSLPKRMASTASYAEISPSPVTTMSPLVFFKNTSGEYLSTFEVKIPGAGTFDVPYTMKGGVVTNMELIQK